MLRDNYFLRKINNFIFFIKNENGAILLPFIIFLPVFIGLIFLSFEISHFTQKKARLSDAIEQATLALTVENNDNPDDNQQQKNTDLVRNYASAYLPSERFSDAKIEINKYQDHLEYNVAITMNYPASFLNKVSFLGKNRTIEAHDNSAAIKYIPIDSQPTNVVFVTDYSGSMNDHFDNSHIQETKIEALRRIFKDLESIIKNNSNINFIGFAPFSWGSKLAYGNNSDNLKYHAVCHFPFVPKKFRIDNDYLSQYTLSGLKKFPELKTLEDIDTIQYGQCTSNDYDRIHVEINNKIDEDNDNYKKAHDHLEHSCHIEYFDTIVEIIEDNIDYKKTIESINRPDKTLDIKLSSVLDKDICLRDSDAYIYDIFNMQKTDFSKLLEAEPSGGTLVSSGILAGNNMLNYTSNKKLMIILSDGNDDSGNLTTNISQKLIDMGMCERIRENGIKMAFIAIGYEPRDDIDWKKCVGNENFYLAHNAHELEIDIKQALVTNTEVGRNIPKN